MHSKIRLVIGPASSELEAKMKNIELFLKHFDRIHKAISSKSRDQEFEYSSFLSDLKKLRNKNKIVTKHFHELKNFAEFRNVDAHTNHIAPHFAEPHAAIVKCIEEIANELNPEAKAFDCAVKHDQIFTAKFVDNAKNVIQYMIENNFTHVPILGEEDRLIGVFSESSVFNYFRSHDEIILEHNITISEFENFINIDARPNETFRFVSRQELLATVKGMFAAEQQKRLGAIFITENGRPSEKLLGLITPWDALSY